MGKYLYLVKQEQLTTLFPCLLHGSSMAVKPVSNSYYYRLKLLFLLLSVIWEFIVSRGMPPLSLYMQTVTKRLSYLMIYDFREVFDRWGPVIVDLSISFWVIQIQNRQSAYEGWITSKNIDFNRHLVYFVSCKYQKRLFRAQARLCDCQVSFKS